MKALTWSALVGLALNCCACGANGELIATGDTPSPASSNGSGGDEDVPGNGDPDEVAGPPPDAGLQQISVPATDRTKVQLRDGWKFKASNTLTGAEAVGFNDSAWSTVSVPHTWDSVESLPTPSERSRSPG